MKPGRNPRRSYNADGSEIEPMTLANMRQNGVQRVEAICQRESCGHAGVIDVSDWPESVYVPDVGLKLVCSQCGGRQINTRPYWADRPKVY